MCLNGHNCRPSGFTLLEVTVTIAIAAFTVVPAATMLLNIQRATSENATVMQAGFLARSMMERHIKNMDLPVDSTTIKEVTHGTDPDSQLPYLVRHGIGNGATASAQVDVTMPNGNTVTLMTLYKE